MKKENLREKSKNLSHPTVTSVVPALRASRGGLGHFGAFLFGALLLAGALSSCLAPPSLVSLKSSGAENRNKVTVLGLESLSYHGVDHGTEASSSSSSSLNDRRGSHRGLGNPAEEIGVVLTLIDHQSGAAKKLFHIIGSGNLDLSGVPDGVYTLMAESQVNGFQPPPAQEIVIKNERFENVELQFQKVSTGDFYYYWESDHLGREFEYSVNEDVSNKIEFLDDVVEVSQNSAAQLVSEKYNLILEDQSNVSWSYDLASKLLRALDSLPHQRLEKTARISLTSRELLNDIHFESTDGHYNIKLSLAAFAYASERMVKLNGVRGKFFSRRLFNALVHFYTNNGKNSRAVAKILNDKFGITTTVNNYVALTATREPASHFQDFKPNELVKIINAFAEMPEGFYQIQGLRYLLRRLDGHPHPLYPNAAAVAWPRGSLSNSYIEFMDTAFISQTESDTHRLILHEKAHFLWENIFTQELKNDWIEVGQWWENPKTKSGWSTRDTTSFVSAYAHDKNPNEDMAESIAAYILNPDILLSRSKKKFRFIEERVMNGYRYVSQIREDLTFQVLNLFPDYDYPGKIRRVEVWAKGDPNQDKRVTIRLELTNKEGISDSASRALTRITSPADTMKDVYLYPVNGNGHLLEGSITIPKNAKSGHWTIQNIRVTDPTGLERYEGVEDFGFKLYINNAIEDITPPQYVEDSIAMGVKTVTRKDNREIYEVSTTWTVKEDVAMIKHSPVYANMISLDHAHLYRITGYGFYNEDTKKARVKLILTEHHPPGRYGITYINMKDRALNTGYQYFSNDPEQEAIRFITIDSRDPDYGKPVLDPNRITIQADPANPNSLDGRTHVQINFYAKDDKSGLGLVYYRLLDPIGGKHFYYFYHKNTYGSFYKDGDPTVYKKYTIRNTLPKGSAPGRWGLVEMVLHDKAGNINTYHFVETLHFTALAD